MYIKVYKSYCSFEERIFNFQLFRILLRVKADFDFKFLLITVCNLNIKFIWDLKTKRPLFVERKFLTFKDLFEGNINDSR